MNDIYLSLANSQLGKNIISALNLPKPPVLIRSPDQALEAPKGRVLLAGSKNNILFKYIQKSLDLDGVTLCTPDFEKAEQDIHCSMDLRLSRGVHKRVKITEESRLRFKTMIFDATGICDTDGLKSVYTFFHLAIHTLKKNGRVIIFGPDPARLEHPTVSAMGEALCGFTRSLAKEIGRKGATCNLVQVSALSQRQILSTIYFLMSPKSAFVTGQTLSLHSRPGLPRKINWSQPLAGKTAIVTGAAQGIGEETARSLARDGATVVCLDIPHNKGQLEKLAASLEGHAVSLDLSDAEAPEKLMRIVGSQLGVVDILVHNAGITRDKTLAKMPPHFWNQVLDINLSKIIRINDLLLKNKALNKNARIVCVSSISGIAGNFGQTNYASSKAGIIGYVTALAPTLENGMTINAVAPGFIETKMTGKMPLMTRELGRRSNTLSQGGLPIDIAEAISFFSHPLSQSVNGNVLRVCGQSLMGK